MSRGYRAKKPKSNKLYTLTEKQLKRVKNEVIEETCTKINLLYLGTLAERGWTDDELIDIFLAVNKYTDYIDKKIVKLREIQSIIEKRTGLKFIGKW